METLFIPNEKDFKKWIKEAVEESLKVNSVGISNIKDDGNLLNRTEIAAFLRVSLVTLTDWMKRGLPSHKQRGRVYFMKSEVLDYIKKTKMKQVKLGSRLQHLNNEIL
ncbi:helix-turn-helix domain-containing protein [Ferruginibacter sp.]|uniref:helix-turn-helix domain-containing protein n=1 Tax=Ferruginibacter sp. TaxID=1940288 RepID=UPI0019AA3607|nr:helix-turn-helix domain-containing protein [Ferruginibacter sp.]MBC7629545.1 helix-turn-helix domain-containing protein [Ferruginibacter sp.]